ncbi:MAG: methyltransferase, TIGR04325 family [Terriglobia bacterium]
MAVLAAKPFCTILRRIAEFSFGRGILNRLSQSRGVFQTFNEGWQVARKARPAGHEHPSEIEVHLEFSEGLRSSDYAVLYWLLQISPQGLKIFDYGGSAGNLYYSYSQYLKGVRRLDWTVYDIPSVIEAGERVATQRRAVGLRFARSLGDACDCNVLLVSSAFHYWEDTVEAFLDQFTEPPEHILLTRTPVHEKQPSFITVQRTQTCAFPCVVRNASELVSSFAVLGYTLVDRWPAPEQRLRIPLFPERTVPHSSGFYFRRQKLA